MYVINASNFKSNIYKLVWILDIYISASMILSRNTIWIAVFYIPIKHEEPRC